MNTLTFATIILCLFEFLAQAIPITVRQVFGYKNGSVEMNQNKLVEGYTDCGSVGQLISFSFGNCEKTPCTLEVGVIYNWELIFFVAGRHIGFEITVDVKRGDEIENVTYYKLRCPLDPGHIAFNFPTEIEARHKGFNELQLRVIASGVNEACLLADVIIK